MAQDYKRIEELRKIRGGKKYTATLKNQEEVNAFEEILKTHYCESLGQLVRKLVYKELELH